MSDLGTKIMAVGLVVEGMAVEILEQELNDLSAKVESGVPVCPVCKITMRQRNYNGYYDAFSYWECDCEHFENGSDWSGAYA